MPKPYNTHFMDYEDDEGVEYLLEYTIEGGCAAQTYGDPSNCWPAEAPEVTIWVVTNKSTDLELSFIESEETKAEQFIIDHHEEPQPDPDYYRD